MSWVPFHSTAGASLRAVQRLRRDPYWPHSGHIPRDSTHKPPPGSGPLVPSFKLSSGPAARPSLGPRGGHFSFIRTQRTSGAQSGSGSLSRRPLWRLTRLPCMPTEPPAWVAADSLRDSWQGGLGHGPRKPRRMAPDTARPWPAELASLTWPALPSSRVTLLCPLTQGHCGGLAGMGRPGGQWRLLAHDSRRRRARGRWRFGMRPSVSALLRFLADMLTLAAESIKKEFLFHFSSFSLVHAHVPVDTQTLLAPSQSRSSR